MLQETNSATYLPNGEDDEQQDDDDSDKERGEDEDATSRDILEVPHHSHHHHHHHHHNHRRRYNPFSTPFHSINSDEPPPPLLRSDNENAMNSKSPLLPPLSPPEDVAPYTISYRKGDSVSSQLSPMNSSLERDASSPPTLSEGDVSSIPVSSALPPYINSSLESDAERPPLSSPLTRTLSFNEGDKAAPLSSPLPLPEGNQVPEFSSPEGKSTTPISLLLSSPEGRSKTPLSPSLSSLESKNKTPLSPSSSSSLEGDPKPQLPPPQGDTALPLPSEGNAMSKLPLDGNFVLQPSPEGNPDNDVTTQPSSPPLPNLDGDSAPQQQSIEGDTSLPSSPLSSPPEDLDSSILPSPEDDTTPPPPPLPSLEGIPLSRSSFSPSLTQSNPGGSDVDKLQKEDDEIQALIDRGILNIFVSLNRSCYRINLI